MRAPDIEQLWWRGLVVLVLLASCTVFIPAFGAIWGKLS